MGWTGFGCKSVWRDLSKLAVTYFCRRLSVGIEEGWRSASTCETSAPLDPLPYTISLHPPPPPCYPSTPPPPQIAFLPPNLALTAVHAFSFHLNTKKWESFFQNSLPTSSHYWSFPAQSSSTGLYFQVLWLIDEQPDEKRNKQQFSESESWPLLYSLDQ